MMVSVFAMLQMPEIIGLLILALILFGAKKLPELAKGLGHGIKEFKKATRDVTDELQSAIDMDRPSSSSRHTQYPSYTEPASTESNESNPGYGEQATPSETAPGDSVNAPAEPKPHDSGSELGEEARTESGEPANASASPRPGQPD